ncbi:amidase [Sphingosinicella microcystinivorans]|uniref:Amidase n=1 Tax=Sphingosinicella microcystinivorans TaxID=335406 RepID=A0AAD1D8G1_SPHMI|nr:amidase [Sphingosinicella microcystinivorans]RKS94298.1 amidase [Sphingosinicella microcystinivorans]BBE35282.1 amidase [Sphingosinicella microcystinivorans]
MPIVMSWEEWASRDTIALAELVRAGQVSPQELAEQARAGIERVNEILNAVIEIFDDVVADPSKDGLNAQGIFAGAPYLMKDIGPALKGRKQEMGSLLMKGYVTPEDSFLTKKIRSAGLNIIGRTTTPEFAVCGSAENPRIYISSNPWNVTYTTGGSSSGSAAIIASGAVPLAHASDGGGSIRGPAGINGNIGLKPSRGVLSAAPEGSDLTNVMAVQGCNSRSVRDTAAFFDACRGGAPGEFMPYWQPPEPYSDLIRRDPPKLKIALSHQWGDYRAIPHFIDELQKAGRLFQELGHDVEWKTPDVDFRKGYAAQTTCYITHVAASLDRLIALNDSKNRILHDLEPMNAKIWEAGIDRPYFDRAQMQITFNQLSRAFGAFFQDWDILLTPVMALPTHKLGAREYLTLNESDEPEVWFDRLWSLYPYTALANICGLPGISLPMALQQNGLPLGIHAMSGQANDGLLLQLAAQVERALDGRWNLGRLPAVHVTMPVS